MGQKHRIKWDKNLIVKSIYEVKEYYGLDRMPTHSEIENYYGNSCLTNKISKTGGFAKHAKDLGLKIKDSESKLGIQFEKYAAKLLERQGFKTELTSVKYPYDILVNNRVKIDVKVGRKIKNKVGEYYTFNLEKKQQTCDIYIAICINPDKEVQKAYIIPANALSGKTQLSVGANHSKYDCYLNKYSVVKVLDNAMKGLEELWQYQEQRKIKQKGFTYLKKN